MKSKTKFIVQSRNAEDPKQKFTPSTLPLNSLEEAQTYVVDAKSACTKYDHVFDFRIVLRTTITETIDEVVESHVTL